LIPTKKAQAQPQLDILNKSVTGRAGVRAAERRHRPPLSAAAAMKALHIQNEVRCHGSWLLLPLLQSVR